MTHVTSDSKFSTEAEAVEDVLKNQVSKRNPVGDRYPICAKYQLSPKKMQYGMQFWTLEQIKAGFVLNFDNTKCFLC